MVQAQLKQTRDVDFKESHFSGGNRNFLEFCPQEGPSHLTKEEYSYCIQLCADRGWLVDGPVLANRFRDIGHEFSTDEIIQLFTKCVDGAGSATCTNNTRVSGNLLDVASALALNLIQRSDYREEKYEPDLKRALDDLYLLAGDSAVVNRSNPELALACLAISGWAFDMDRGLFGRDRSNIPNSGPAYYFAG